MSYWTGRATLANGDNSFTGVGFQPNWVRISVAQKYGASETWQHLCIGQSDGTRTNCITMYGDTTTAKTLEDNTHIVLHYDKVSGVWTKVLEATFVSFDADGFTINATTGNSNYKVHLECGN